MFEYLKGMVTAVMPSYIVVDVAGVGYRIITANPFAFTEQQVATVYVEQIVRDNEQTLYGFQTLDEKTLFQKLLAVSGIGPKSALAILASSDHTGLVQAIVNDDVTFLTKFPGIGKKTAQQIILDLQNKVDELPFQTQMDQFELDVPKPKAGSDLDEALQALEALGYAKKDLKRIEKQLQTEALADTAAYVSAGLKLLQ
ncbi:Holliday junction DNA helicase [Weissella viridescens]|uniref:Holliday junction branch migration complex subunit RuvA n=1 Tax=Weissella viridescens TaxID=1629 RepID=A0A0R2H0J2_WEIVI|nr:Holliday junction branch migration protein RuvA [Weissella viridescens]KRN46232.1 holliday junction atp-dependent dna helicase ruva [Weissella viridescens]QOD86638.1 Holliday junction branch migration protein RuvA [Weissella viridescens]WJI91773.1 Holliday junction branch migration protein RuvA [Weissella viridescens]SOB44607.1 Holliday junction DNA helicase [Weissella viridescens]GEA95414.1 Holliday junction ATP-dependent DNA helicase RuvA [Weissella viridescens]